MQRSCLLICLYLLSLTLFAADDDDVFMKSKLVTQASDTLSFFGEIKKGF